MTETSKPIAVLISDIHFSISTLEIASECLKEAIKVSKQLKVPLVIAGDLLDSKAIIRAEVANSLLTILDNSSITPIILVGNHDMTNEKGEEHALNFLRNDAFIIDCPVFCEHIQSYLIPYYSDKEQLKQCLTTIPKGSRIIMHQGVETADMGHYVQDRTSLPKEVFKDFRVISGHYHKRQDIKCGPPRKNGVGLFSYVGNPYTLGFGESDHPEKGIQVLYSNGLLEFVPLKCRKHVIVEFEWDNIKSIDISKADILSVKIKGPESELAKLDKQVVANLMNRDLNFKLEKIVTESSKVVEKVEKASNADLLDAIIDASEETDEQKENLKRLWRQILDEPKKL